VPEGRTFEEVRYASPEQVSAAPVGETTDVYSLALALTEALTGELPHDAPTLDELRRRRVGAPLPQRPELGALDLPLALAAAPDPAARPTAALLSARLEAVAASLPVPLPLGTSAMTRPAFTAPSPETILTAPAEAAPARTDVDDPYATPVLRPLDLPGYRDALVSADIGGDPEATSTGTACELVRPLPARLGAASAWALGVFTASSSTPSLIGLDNRSSPDRPRASPPDSQYRRATAVPTPCPSTRSSHSVLVPAPR
jgi:serine/threonine-protein kinase